MKINKQIILFISAVIINIPVLHNAQDQKIKHYYCSASDEKYYPLLKNLIGSIHNVDFDNLGQIAVFDLGLNSIQINELANMHKVQVYKVEMTNPDILTYFESAGRRTRGHFTWKPVVIKQALDLFPHVLYCDAGTTILKPLNKLFKYINEKGYFLYSCTANANCNIVNRITKNTLEKIVYKLSPEKQALVLRENTTEIDGGLQGMSRKMLDSLILPIYNLTRDVSLFIDDGSSKFGPGAGRNDQIMSSIYAHCLNLKIHPEGLFNLEFNTGSEKMHIHWDGADINDSSIIYRSRHDINFKGGKTQYVRYKNQKGK